MSTAIEGLVLNPHGFIAVYNATVVAVATDGVVEGSTTTNSQGYFSLSGLSEKSWLAKVISVPEGKEPAAHQVLLLPNSVAHSDLSGATADLHHAGFIGLLDNASAIVGVDSNDYITITGDGIIKADALGGDGGTLHLSFTQTAIDHGAIGGLADDDHTQYALLAGRSGGQEIHGGTATDDNLTLRSTSNLTKGSVILGEATLFELNETVGQLLLPTIGSSAGLLVGGDVQWYRSAADVWQTPDSVTIDGTLTAANIVPASDATYDLGAADNEWNDLYVNTITVSGEATIQEMVRLSFGTWSAGAGGAMFFDGNDMKMNARNIGDGNWHWEGDMVPETEETNELFDLGSEDSPWDNLHVNNLGVFENRGDLLKEGDEGIERIRVGADGQQLRSDGLDPVWENDDYNIEFIIDGGGSAIETGEKGHVEVPSNGIIEGWTVLGDQSGSIVVDVWKDTYANFPPVDGDSITGAAPPTLSSAQKNQNLTLTVWTTAITKGDIIAFNVDSITTCERVTVSLRLRKT